MAGVLIEMRGAILRRSVSYHGASGARGRLVGGLLLALFVTLLAAEPALVIGSAGLLALIGVRSVVGPAPDGGPAPARVLKTNASVIALPVITLLPAVALLVAGTIAQDVAVRWLAVPVGLAWGAFLCWRSVRLAQQRLESHGPEIFARVRG